MYNSYDLSRNSVSGSAMKGKRKPFYCPSYYVQSEQREKELKNDGRWNPFFFFFFGGGCVKYIICTKVATNGAAMASAFPLYSDSPNCEAIE